MYFTVISILIFVTFVLQKAFKVVLVVVAQIFVVHEVSTSMILFWIPNINKTNHAYTVFQFFNFGLHYYYNFNLKPRAIVYKHRTCSISVFTRG